MSTFKSGIVRDWTTAAGLRAVVRMTTMGHHCGYVGVPAGHPLHGVEYGQPCDALQEPAEGTPVGKRGVIALLAAAFDESRRRAPEIVFDVHGGLTDSGGRGDYPADDGGGAWWFGFDCAHCDDAPHPDAGRDPLFQSGVFRDEGYVADECESLARQIVAATGGAS